VSDQVLDAAKEGVILAEPDRPSLAIAIAAAKQSGTRRALAVGRGKSIQILYVPTVAQMSK